MRVRTRPPLARTFFCSKWLPACSPVRTCWLCSAVPTVARPSILPHSRPLTMPYAFSCPIDVSLPQLHWTSNMGEAGRVAKRAAKARKERAASAAANADARNKVSVIAVEWLPLVLVTPAIVHSCILLTYGVNSCMLAPRGSSVWTGLCGSKENGRASNPGRIPAGNPNPLERLQRIGSGATSILCRLP